VWNVVSAGKAQSDNYGGERPKRTQYRTDGAQGDPCVHVDAKDFVHRESVASGLTVFFGPKCMHNGMHSFFRCGLF
jgi:hypothetical protein